MIIEIWNKNIYILLELGGLSLSVFLVLCFYYFFFISIMKALFFFLFYISLFLVYFFNIMYFFSRYSLFKLYYIVNNVLLRFYITFKVV